MGDFNSLRPEDFKQTKEKSDLFLRYNQNFKERKDYETYFIPVFKELCLAEVIPLIRSKGLIEASIKEKNESTFPTPLFLNMKTPIAKIDYIFHTPDIFVNDYQVLTGEVFDKTSDHYPIVGELSFK